MEELNKLENMSNEMLDDTLEYLAISYVSIKIKLSKRDKEHTFPEIHSMLFRDLKDGVFYAMALDHVILVDGNSIEDVSNKLFLSIIDLFELKRELRKGQKGKNMLSLVSSKYWDKFKEFRAKEESIIINNIFDEIDSYEKENESDYIYTRTEEGYYEEVIDFLTIDSNKGIVYANGIEIIEAKLKMKKLVG